MKKGHAVARVTFTANRELVRKALAAGWSAKAIYEQNATKLTGISYRQFVRYVADLRDGGPPTPASETPAAPPPAAKPHRGITDGRTFNHDPEVLPSARDRILGRKAD